MNDGRDPAVVDAQTAKSIVGSHDFGEMPVPEAEAKLQALCPPGWWAFVRSWGAEPLDAVAVGRGKHYRLFIYAFALHEAASTGNSARLESLLAQGAKVNERNEFGDTALFTAVKQGHVIAARLLLDKDADPTIPGSQEWTPLHAAAYRGFIKPIEMLLDAGVSVDAQNDMGDTPLITALRMGRKDAVRLLVERGSNINHQNRAGETPLFGAIGCGYADLVEELLVRGADANARNAEGETPLTYAKGVGRGISKLIRQHGGKK